MYMYIYIHIYVYTYVRTYIQVASKYGYTTLIAGPPGHFTQYLK